MAYYPSLGSYLDGERERLEKLQKANIDFENGLEIGGLFMSDKPKKGPGYSTTEQVDQLIMDEYGVKGDRHRIESGFRPSLRESHTYPKGSEIRQERHILAGTQNMLNQLSGDMNLYKTLTSENLGWNLFLQRQDGEDVSLEGLPVGTDFMVYPKGIQDITDKTRLIVNLRLVTQQNGCSITGANIARDRNNPDLRSKFIDNSESNRGSVLVIDGPVGEHVLKVGQKVFVGLPTGRIK